MKETMDLDAFYASHERVTKLSQAEYRVLESLRYQDKDTADKAMSILTFSALLMTIGLVILGSLDKGEPSWLGLCLLTTLMIAVGFAMMAFIWTGAYTLGPGYD